MNIVADLHTHSISSGHAYSTVKEIILAAKAAQLELVAITDHGPAMLGAPTAYHFGNLSVLPAKYDGIEILYGVEANIIDNNGNLDLSDYYLKKLDIVLAGLHEESFKPVSVEENTLALIQAIKNPYVDIIVHPGNPAFMINPEKVVQASKEYGVALEVNNSSLTICRKGSLERCTAILKYARQYGSLIALGSDAHWADSVGKFVEAKDLLCKSQIQEEQVLNTNKEKVLQFLQTRKQHKK